MKKNKILKLVTTMIIVILVGICGYSYAEDITNYLTILNNPNDYLRSTDAVKQSYIGKSVGIPESPGNNDYKAYITNDDYRTLWCLGDRQMNTSGSWLYIKGIIEVGTPTDPSYTKIFSSSGMNTINANTGRKDRAESALVMRAGKDTTDDNMASIVQKFFYNNFRSVLESNEILKNFNQGISLSDADTTRKTTINGKQMDEEEYGTAITNISQPVSDYGKNNYKNLVNESYNTAKDDSHTKTGNTKGYYAYISKPDFTTNILNFSTDNSLVTAREIIIKSDSGTRTYNLKKERCKDTSEDHWYLYNSSNVLSGRVTMNGRIYLYEDFYKIGNDIQSVEYKVKYKYIHSILYMLGGRAEQARGVSLSEIKDGYYSHKVTIAENTSKANVSMQKYITKVENADGIVTQNLNNTRLNAKSTSAETSTQHVSSVGVFKKISKRNSVNSYDKKANAVSIEAGDKVTYRLYVYNNNDNDIDNITLTDRLPYYSDGGTNKIAVEVVSVKDKNGDVNYDTKNDTGAGVKLLVIEGISLGTGTNRSKWYDITLKFTKSLNGTITNTAWVSCDGNENEYRTLDKDYVQMTSDYGVSLEKYVTKVGETSISGRNGHTIYDEKPLSANTKYKDPVEVDVGDYVIYTLKLTNTTSSDRSIKVDKITDKFNKDKLRFDSIGSDSYGGAKKGSETTSGSTTTLTITMDSPTEIAKGSSVYIYLKFEVIGEGTIENLATVGINDISNKNGVGVTDNDEEGAENNTDRDWLKTKEYSVSLEKYVTKVNETSVTERDGHPVYDEPTTKSNTPVELEVGDLVTYTIKLTNTTDYPLKVTKVIDTFDRRLTYQEDIGITGSGYDSITVERDGNKLTIELDGDLIEPGHSRELYVPFTVDVPKNETGTVQRLENKAEVTEIKNKNDKTVKDTTDDDNIDKDRVKTKIYAVSLEKFITKVTAGNGSSPKDITGRNGKRYNEKSTSGNKNMHKLNNKVEVEPGDLVTYTIRLKNVRTDTSVKITEIYDDVAQSKAGLNLVYGGAPTVTGTKGSVYTVSGPTGTEYKIASSNPALLGPEETEDLTLVFRVDVDTSLTDVSQELKNKAGIVSLKNRNNADVMDSNGENDNHDEDWVKTKTYAVSLQKYVSKVNGVDVPDKAQRVDKQQYTYNTAENYKYKNPVTVKNEDIVEYTIKVKNDGNTVVNIKDLSDYLPNGVWGDVQYSSTDNTADYCTAFEHKSSSNYDANGNLKTNKDNGQQVANKKQLLYDNIAPGTEAIVTISVTVIEPNISQKILKNVAEITTMSNRNGVIVKDTTKDNNKDADYIQMDYEVPTAKSYTVQKDWGKDSTPENVTVRLYKVKADGTEEYITGKEVVLSIDNNWTHEWEGLDKDLTYIARELSQDKSKIVKDTTKYSNDITTEYTQIEDGIIITNYKTTTDFDKIDYTVVKVWDDNDNQNRPTSIKVRLFKNSEKVEDVELKDSNWSYTWTGLEKEDGEGNLYNYTVQELNSSNNVIKDGGEYNSEYTVHYLQEADKTTITNKLKDDPEEPDDDNVAIGGTVWNDLALNKTHDDYNGVKDAQEEVLSGVKVMLYREGKGIIATTYTNENGEYCFTNESIDPSIVTKAEERFIKGPRINDTKRWAGTYYYYYVIFEYDGVTYTSTTTKDEDVLGIRNLDYNDSNARENEGKVDQSRTNFNKQFSKVNKEGVYSESGSKTCDLTYSTTNENGYIPQSIHKYNSSDKLNIQSSTKLIRLTSSEELEDQLKHVNLGLRGRDSFDLELTSDVYQTKVTVNNVAGTYDYCNFNTNKVTIRRTDTNNYNYLEDTANPYLDGSKYEDEKNEQYIRETDINVERTVKDKDGNLYGATTTYDDTNLEVEVTYKITVTNASNTAGTATKITNYYDDNFEFLRAEKTSGGATLGTETGTAGTGYKAVVITTPGTNLDPKDTNDLNNTMDIYVVYKLNNPDQLIMNNGGWLATYNMSEITEYKTQCASGQSEATRGLIDKDSAPGSAATEDVRLHPDLVEEGTSTVKYYFSKKADDSVDLSILKYEDDTYATPTLIFDQVEDTREITGTVFEDIAKVNPTTRVKSGNGIKDEDNPKEVGVCGATVQLIELKEESEDSTKIADGKQVEVDGKYYPVRYTRTTDANGEYTFTGYLPGYYIIRYHYGDTNKTVLLNQESAGINAKSYNGEDFQATNNSHSPLEGLDTNKLDSTPEVWYAANEDKGVSTAKDNGPRRVQVSKNLTNESTPDATIELQKQLNRARAGEQLVNPELQNLIDGTKMFATTEPMKLTVEETVKDGGTLGAHKSFEVYRIENMNFGIAEVPVSTIDMRKEVVGFTIVDSTGLNEIASLSKDGDNWVPKGDVIPNLNDRIDVSIEDEKLQGARLEITYEVSVNMTTEKNFDNPLGGGVPSITVLVDFVNNNLSYNEALGDNATYWEVATYEPDKSNTIETGAIDPDGTSYTTVLKAKPENPLLLTAAGEAKAKITLEKVLSSTEATIDEIITSTVDTSEYFNIVEILGLNYDNTKIDTDKDGTVDTPMKDRIRNRDRYIIIPGIHYDSTTSEIMVIHAPTGDSSISMVYYVIAVIGLTVLAVGVFGIKKFVVKK